LSNYLTYKLEVLHEEWDKYNVKKKQAFTLEWLLKELDEPKDFASENEQANSHERYFSKTT